MKKIVLPKSFTTVTPFSKYLALSMLVIFPVIAFYFGVYYEQETHNGVPNPFCKEMRLVCDPNLSDKKGTCYPKKMCLDDRIKHLKELCNEKKGVWKDDTLACEYKI